MPDFQLPLFFFRIVQATPITMARVSEEAPEEIIIAIPRGMLGVKFKKGSCPPEITGFKDSCRVKSRLQIGDRITGLVLPNGDLVSNLTTSNLLRHLKEWSESMNRKLVVLPAAERHSDVSAAHNPSVIFMYNSSDFFAGGPERTIPDSLVLGHLCACVSVPPPFDQDLHSTAESSAGSRDDDWAPVRNWLRSHSADEIRQGAFQRGEAGMTALHYACRNGAPKDIVHLLVYYARDPVEWPDGFGWLPLHYAASFYASLEVMQILVSAYPQGRIVADNGGRTPLHNAIAGRSARNIDVEQNDDGHVDSDNAAEVISLLSSSGAASIADRNKFLPLHIACAKGVAEEVIFILTDAHRDGVIAQDEHGRTPLHLALNFPGLSSTPGTIRHLIGRAPALVNMKAAGGILPLQVLANQAREIRNPDASLVRENCHKCLDELLKARPNPSAGFLTALQKLPDWLASSAVLMPSVQIMLNSKIALRFPAMVLLADLYFLVTTVVCFSLAILLEPDLDHEQQYWIILGTIIIPLYVCAAYFLLLELMQVISLLSMKSFRSMWFLDPVSWLNSAFIILLLVNVVLFHKHTRSDEDPAQNNNSWLRGAQIAFVIVMWFKVLIFLRSTIIEFAVLLNGVLYVCRRLFAFMVALVIILIAFAQMFTTVFQQTPYAAYCDRMTIPSYTAAFATKTETLCHGNDCESRLFAMDIATIEETICPDKPRPFCYLGTAFLACLTMLLGELDESRFEDSIFATFLFILFIFLVVILLANVLIAVVGDNFKVVQNERAAVVFWRHRLDFLTEVTRIQQSFGFGLDFVSGDSQDPEFPEEVWDGLMKLFDGAGVRPGVRPTTMEFWYHVFLRIIAAILVIPVWIMVGLVSFGWFWPPQIRRWLLMVSVSRYSSDSERQDELRSTQVTLLKKELNDLCDDVELDLKAFRYQLAQLKMSYSERQNEISGEISFIMRNLSKLYNQQVD